MIRPKSSKEGRGRNIRDKIRWNQMKPHKTRELRYAKNRTKWLLKHKYIGTANCS